MRSLVAVLLLSLAQEALACTCVIRGDARDEKRRAALTFVGRAVSVETASADLVRITFEVLVAWKRDVPRTVSVLSARDGAACGYVPRAGELHLLFAHRWYPDRKFHIGLCSHNRPLVCAQQDLARLGSPSTRHETLPAWASYGSDDAPLPYWTGCVTQPVPIGDHSLPLPAGAGTRGLAYTVLQSGATRDVSFALECSGACPPDLEARVREAVERWTFTPATLGVRAVAVRFQAYD